MFRIYIAGILTGLVSFTVTTRAKTLKAQLQWITGVKDVITVALLVMTATEMKMIYLNQ